MDASELPVFPRCCGGTHAAGDAQGGPEGPPELLWVHGWEQMCLCCLPKPGAQCAGCSVADKLS